eukprot:TRINITY_DN14835_c0_g1_i1.p1 TRINITY_DN14835_c0_g1~~TRINITY_DN14835_c0_g1_i1.p1  ORF type:complete len:160 (-),score=47.58 TRINITY_DN14835_c0_g1_i1:54-533(-)
MEDRRPLPTWNFSLVVVRNKKGEFLLVDESKNRGYWLPGGRVEGTETFDEAAIRETKEEAGIDVKLLGVLRVQRTPSKNSARIRYIYLAEPIDENQQPKSVPDKESNGAQWISYENMMKDVKEKKKRLRGFEPVHFFDLVNKGNFQMAPLSIFTLEGEF